MTRGQAYLGVQTILSAAERKEKPLSRKSRLLLLEQLLDRGLDLHVAAGRHGVRVVLDQDVRLELVVLAKLPVGRPPAALGDAEAQGGIDLRFPPDERARARDRHAQRPAETPDLVF